MEAFSLKSLFFLQFFQYPIVFTFHSYLLPTFTCPEPIVLLIAAISMCHFLSIHLHEASGAHEGKFTSSFSLQNQGRSCKLSWAVKEFSIQTYSVWHHWCIFDSEKSVYCLSLNKKQVAPWATLWQRKQTGCYSNTISEGIVLCFSDEIKSSITVEKEPFIKSHIEHNKDKLQSSSEANLCQTAG